MPDNVGNTPNTALDISLAPVVKTFTDSVNFGDNDYYRFTLSERSSFAASLQDLNANANVELLNSLGNTININGVPQSSVNGGTLLEAINAILDPGIYYIRVFPGSPADPNNPSSTTPDTSYSLYAIADNDIKSGMLWRNYSTGENQVWQMDGATLTGVSNLTPIAPSGWIIEAVADLNSDQTPDILWRNYDGGEVAAWIMNGNAIERSVTIDFIGDTNWQLVGTADFNDDRKADFIWRNYASGENLVWFMNGTARDSFTYLLDLSTEWALQGVGDFDGDQNADFVWRNLRSGDNFIWLMNGVEFKKLISLPSDPDQNRQIQGTGDFNRDGQTDIVWRNYATGANEAWLMNSTAVASVISLPSQPGAGWVAKASYNSIPNPVGFDLAGNQRQDGLLIGSLNGNGRYQDAINSNDGEDYYKFLLGSTTDLVVTLTGPTGGALSADLDIEVLSASGSVLASGTQSGSTAETFSTSFDAGTYYIRVFPKAVVNASVPYQLDLKVNNRPVLATNAPLTLNEGATKTIDRGTLLITDENNTANQLTYALSASPNSARGDLLFDGNRITTGNRFTQADIDSGKLSYRQNGSETTTDNFVFTVSDGQGGSISATTFSINVTPVNDAPVLTTNVSLTLSEGAVANLSSSNLALTDAEQSTAQLVYTVGDLPTKGSLSLNGALVTKGTTFTQADINSGNKFSYRHDGSESLNDSFTFSAGDGAGGTLTPPVNTFSLQITPVNDLPVLVTNQGV
ncbi:pre-peptidase C-terminal domain-containing protein, partial [Leptolyngbya sp. FACHB-36]|uniref:cadherin-like domain-containing protein n=1 Tax=Leptolyngbya sp. FACHB-36 TaxID=2692808 RepID=UPI00167FE41C